MTKQHTLPDFDPKAYDQYGLPVFGIIRDEDGDIVTHRHDWRIIVLTGKIWCVDCHKSAMALSKLGAPPKIHIQKVTEYPSFGDPYKMWQVSCDCCHIFESKVVYIRDGGGVIQFAYFELALEFARKHLMKEQDRAVKEEYLE